MRLGGGGKYRFKNSNCLPAGWLFFISLYREKSLLMCSKDFGKVLFVRMCILANTGKVKFHCDKSIIMKRKDRHQSAISSYVKN